MKPLKVYLCSYYKTYGYGGFDEIYVMCFANTESEALGLIITEYPKTTASGWSVIEQISDTLGVVEISSRTN